jgi:hypothetical protein
VKNDALYQRYKLRQRKQQTWKLVNSVEDNSVEVIRPDSNDRSSRTSTMHECCNATATAADAGRGNVTMTLCGEICPIYSSFYVALRCKAILERHLQETSLSVISASFFGTGSSSPETSRMTNT